ncbi:hypothetical protein, partial [Stenotrophomonas maltophilia]|uniref:hypothetical protein n=1 Tax=Stenotrophomonas maltophilia TaxID=40324 RepID=UPI0039C2427D
MRNLFLSAIAGALLLSAGCSSQPGAAALESEDAPTAVILLGEVNLPKGATLDDFKCSGAGLTGTPRREQQRTGDGR